MNRVSPDADRSKEEYMLSLLADENDKFERKRTLLLDLTVGSEGSEVRSELAKRLSALANIVVSHPFSTSSFLTSSEMNSLS